jgi:hypothetical protein
MNYIYALIVGMIIGISGVQAEEDFINRLACVIKADGTIARGYKIESCELKGINEYVITWKIPLQGKIPQGVVKTNFSATIGSAMTEPVEAGLITVSLDKDPSKMVVHTFNSKGEPGARPFHIAAFRDY